MAEETSVATVNQAMLDRGSREKEPSVMDNIHKIKLYNANPFASNKEEREVNPELAWKFKIVEAWNWDIKYINSWFKVNILSVCKVKSGNVFVLDEFWDPIKDESGKSKKAFFFTNEHSIYTRKTDMLWFKQAWQKPLGFFVKSDLEEMLRTKKLNGKDNPFWKQWTKVDWEPYNDTNISDTIIIYGQFIWWDYDREYFKFVPVSSSWYWTTYKNGEQVEPSEWTFLYAMKQWLREWNKIRTANNKSEVQSVDPSQIDMTISFREIEVQQKRMFVPVFNFDWLAALRTDNTNDLQYILELQSEYLKEEFGISVMISNFRLWSIKDVATSDISWIEVKAIESKSIVHDNDEEESETVQVVKDAKEIFWWSKVEYTEDWKTIIDWEEIPF